MASHDIAVAPEISAIAPLIEWVERCCGEDGLSGDIAQRMMLVMEETVSNVVAYAFVGVPPPHVIRVRLETAADYCASEVVDNGRPFDPTAAPPPDLARPLEERQPGGLGIHLMQKMTDRLEYRREEGRNRLRIETARR